MIQPLWRAIWQFPKKLKVHTHFISKSIPQRGNSSNYTSRPVWNCFSFSIGCESRMCETTQMKKKKKNEISSQNKYDWVYLHNGTQSSGQQEWTQSLYINIDLENIMLSANNMTLWCSLLTHEKQHTNNPMYYLWICVYVSKNHSGLRVG